EAEPDAGFQAAGRAEDLCRRHLLAEDAWRELADGEGLSEADRRAALRYLRLRIPRAQEARARVASAVEDDGLGRAAYDEALRDAEARCRLDPANVNDRRHLGLAQYRTGRFAEAVKTLGEAWGLAPGSEAERRRLAFRALALCRSDKTGEGARV